MGTEHQIETSLRRAVIRLGIVLVGLVILYSVLSSVEMLHQRISPYSPLLAMDFISALFALIAIGVLWSFRQSMGKQLSIIDSHETSVVVAGILGLLIVGFAYYAYSYLALISLGYNLMWMYNVLFLLLAFGAAFRLVEVVLVRATGRVPKPRSRK